MRLGFDRHAVTDAHIIAMNCALVTAEDVVVGISPSGSTKDLVDAIRIVKNNETLLTLRLQTIGRQSMIKRLPSKRTVCVQSSSHRSYR